MRHLSQLLVLLISRRYNRIIKLQRLGLYLLWNLSLYAAAKLKQNCRRYSLVCLIIYNSRISWHEPLYYYYYYYY